ncbi:MAG: alpha/beta fold hydrolase [Actinomycetota bacterium]|nr:alpha/beta fold hydrolase [Actinomycetota bacterium]
MSTPSPITEDAGIPTSSASAVATYSPVTLPVPGRHVNLQIKVSAPVAGTDLPVILFSHGHGPSKFTSSLHGYGPLVSFWSARGFVVIQPTHQDSTMLGLREMDDPDAPLYARSRAEDMRFILDHLDDIEATVPGLAGRMDRGRIAVVGHSMGGHTAGMLCGQQMTDPVTAEKVILRDDRIKVGVPIAPPGRGDDLANWASANYPVLGTTTFENMETPALVVVGENDANPRFSDRADWRSDAYLLSPEPKSRLLFFGAEHLLGGISGWDSAETTDESPVRVAALRALVWAFLRSSLYSDDPAWTDAAAALNRMTEPLGTVESK